MKVIKDIRIFQSKIDNVASNPLPSGIINKQLHIIIHRLVMKLREFNFSFGDFDHLYVNLTTCLLEGTIQEAKRNTKDSWYRYVDIGISEDFYNHLEIESVIKLIEKVLLQYSNDANLINLAVSNIFNQEMLMKFKEKKASKTKAVIYLRYLDNGKYLPLLCVYDLLENELLHQDLPMISDLSSLGEIQLSSKKITIKPRKNIYTKNLSPLTFEIHGDKKMKINSVLEYIESLNDDGKKYVNDFIEFMKREYPKMNHKISFSMPMWLVGKKMNEGYVAISAAKSHFSIHFSNENFIVRLGEKLSNCKTGKRCINIKYGDDIAYQEVKAAVIEFLN